MIEFTFSNRRYVEGGSYDRTTPWLAGVELSTDEKAQLLALVQLFDPKMTLEELLSGDTRFFKDRASALAECPLEWWDVGTEGERYRLWLCYADSGYLFAVGDTRRLATIIQGDFDIDEELSEPLRSSIVRAAREAARMEPGSLLGEVSFGES